MFLIQRNTLEIDKAAIMPTDASEESGLEELHRLSREIRDMEGSFNNELVRARERISRAGKKQALWEAIKEIKISMVIDKLNQVSPPEILEAFESFKDGQYNGDLRKLILGLLDELENRADRKELDTASTEKLIKTLGILTEFLFYIE